MLQRESKHSVSCLTRNPDDIFRLVFVNRINHSLLKYDQIYRVPGNHLARMSSSNLRGESKAMTVTQKIFDVLDRGLQGRIESLEFVFSNITSAFISEKGAPIGDLTIGLFVKPENINRSIDKGPLIEQKELASEFRRFWGKRAEARQFKDGTTVECVLWDQSSALPVLEQIILYLFARHFSASVETSKHLYQTQFRTCFRQELSHMDASLHLYDRIRKDSEKLSQSLQDIAKQPLQIRQISPISAHSRQTSIKLTKSYGNSLLPLDPIELNVQFEGSSGWPSQISAVQRTKIAFLLKIREVMEEAEVDLSESSVGLERTNSEFCNIAFLDVKYPGGLLFRIRIHHEGEEQLLKQMAESSSEGPRVQDEASASLESYRRDFINRGLLTQLVSTLSTKFPALPPTIRITKHWFASHMLLPHFDEELVEIFCIHVFTQPHPWKTPGSPENGFFRVVHMLARWNWALEPLLVNLSTESRISTSGLRLMRNHFVSLRKIDPVFNRIALFVGTNIDHEGISWTRRRPQKVVAARMTMLARALDDAICYSDPHVLNLSHFLTSRLSDFDFTIHLKPKFYNLSSEQDLSTERSKSYKNLITQNEVSISLDRRSLADTYFAELETRFSASALFFRDPVETKVIAGLWLREKGSRNWKPSLAYSSEPVASSKTNAEVQINKEATLNDIARLGGDMVSKYELF
ncbi:MAG: hypothetical protein M1814_002528 [Vezdaea aestivalis]|nr:MAG: hypothetical protein M1814_002528 [Vezdaea aestivalis]